ncbi:MAG: serine hydrolase [Candidatus Kapabacteria bacterium]|nr:serine hydrolase [Candidatus Kapabacteria bacterium]
MRILLSALVLCVSFVSASAQAQVERRLADICSILGGQPMQFDTVFTSDFLRQVPQMQLTVLVQQLTKESGGCSSTRIVESQSPFSAKAEALTVNGYTIPISISVTAQPPHRIEGLFFKAPVKASASLTEVLADLKALAGSTSFFAKNLTTGAVLASSDTTSYLPIGSSFKLYVLGELVRSIARGEHRWDEVVVLDSSRYSFPSGILQTWPHGSPVTLHTLASQMISISDNTATDILLNHLGERAVQNIQRQMGHSKPELNDPFLSTRQLFFLKFSDNGKRAIEYATLDARGRAQLLRTIETSVSKNDVDFVESTVLPDKVEWFARTPDLVRAMDWLHLQAKNQKVEPLLGVLGINPGLDINRKVWSFVGYKGGSETGVLNMTFLLQHNNGHWYALSASWMRTDSDVELVSFSGLIERAIQLLAP